MKKILFTVYILLSTAPAALAAVETEQDVLRILNRVVDWMFTLLLVISVIFIILAAYNYLFAAGDAEKVKKAHLMIVYAVVAIAVGLLARGVSFIVEELILGGPPPPPTRVETRGPASRPYPIPLNQ